MSKRSPLVICWCFLPGTGPSNPSSLKRRINSCRETGVNLDNCHRLPGRSSYGLAVYGWNRQSPLQPGYNPLFDYFDKLISAIFDGFSCSHTPSSSGTSAKYGYSSSIILYWAFFRATAIYSENILHYLFISNEI